MPGTARSRFAPGKCAKSARQRPDGETVTVTTVHEIQVRPTGTIPLTSHDVPVDFVVTPDRVIDCRARRAPRPVAGIVWDDLTEEKIAAIPRTFFRPVLVSPWPVGGYHLSPA